MAPKFGTSGLRGLVSELTPDLIEAHVTAFLRACPVGSGLFVARDLRDSSPRIVGDVIRAARACGVDVTDCGTVPTPALALAAMAAGAAAVMVTGSHIPADRNGLKFYTPTGEITKADEAAILAALGGKGPAGAMGAWVLAEPAGAYCDRYLRAFGPQALSGQRIGVWAQSAVGRDLLARTLAALGAEVVEIGRSETFIPIDTEAVSAGHRALLADAVAGHRLAAIVSTDGDSDRPLVVDDRGRIVPGDILGQITARLLGAEVVVTPLSSNSGVEALGFARVLRTRIGSPFVIAAMEAAGAARVIGYEANGGVLLGFDAIGPAGPLPRLMTRDAMLPIVACLVAAGREGLAARVGAEPPRFTAADRLEGVATAASLALIDRLRQNPAERSALLGTFGPEQALDLTDGLRLTFATGRVLHLRPSGNAPEMRVYAEAESPDQAQAALALGIDVMRAALGAPDRQDI